MSFIAKNPLTMPQVESSPSAPQDGTRGIFAGGDGWYDIDSNSNTRKIATDEDIDSLADTCQKKFATVHIAGGLDNWIRETIEDGDGNIIGFRYGQEVKVNDATITPCSKVDLQISSEQMVVFYEKSLAFVAENEDSVVTIYCVGGIPKNDYIVQAVVTEVATQTAKIVGNVVGLPNPQSDWEQKDKTKADYIKNKPDYENEFSNALKGSAAGVNTLRIDDVSPTKHTIALNVSRINLLPSPFAELDFLEQGKKYTLSAKLKDDATINRGAFWGIKWEELIEDEYKSIDVVFFWDGEERTEYIYTFRVNDVTKNYSIYTNGFTTDMFEYCQLEEGIVATEPTPYIEDLNNVTFYKFGKNLLNYDYSNWYSYQYHNGERIVTRYVMDLNIPCDCVVTMGRKKEAGIYYIRKYEGIFEGAGENVNTNGYAFASAEQKPLKQAITKEDGYLYRLETSKGYYEADYIAWLQVEYGLKNSDATEYEPYKEPEEIIDINNVSIDSNATIISDTSGVNIETTYNKDINKVIADLTSAIISLGGNV